MTTRYVKLTDVVQRTGITIEVVERLESEDLIHPKRSLDDEVLLSDEDAERIRIIRILTEELEVNLEGAAVILHMRDEMLAMQHQFDDVLAALVAELRARIRG